MSRHHRAHRKGPGSFWHLWGWPLLLAALTGFGLIVGLLGDGWWDTISAAALGVPVLAGAWFALRPRRQRP